MKKLKLAPDRKLKHIEVASYKSTLKGFAAKIIMDFIKSETGKYCGIEYYRKSKAAIAIFYSELQDQNDVEKFINTEDIDFLFKYYKKEISSTSANIELEHHAEFGHNEYCIQTTPDEPSKYKEFFLYMAIYYFLMQIKNEIDKI